MDEQVRKARLAALRMLAHDLREFQKNPQMQDKSICTQELGEGNKVTVQALGWALGVLQQVGLTRGTFDVVVEEVLEDKVYGQPGFMDFRLERGKDGQVVSLLPPGSEALMEAVRLGMTGNNRFMAWSLKIPDDVQDREAFVEHAETWLLVLQGLQLLPKDWKLAQHKLHLGGSTWFVADATGKRLPFEGKDDLGQEAAGRNDN